jgi:hypothetical protein
MANQVQNQLASGILDQFHVNIGLNLQTKLQDWSGRQDVAYESMKGLMVKDWHSLSDFNLQMSLYSATNLILRIAWDIIKNVVPNNPQMLATLVHIPGFGINPLGASVLSLVGVSNIIIAPQDILNNATTFQATISSVS